MQVDQRLEFGELANSQEEFIQGLVMAKSNSMGNGPDSTSEAINSSKFSMALRNVVSLNILNPHLDNFLVLLFQNIQQNDLLKDINFINELLEYYVRPAFVIEMNRCKALGDSDLQNNLKERFAMLISGLPIDVQVNNAIDDEEIDCDFKIKLIQFSDGGSNFLTHIISILIARLQVEPESIFKDTEYVSENATLYNNLYFLIKNAIRRFLINYPSDSREPNIVAQNRRLKSLINNPLGFFTVEKMFIELIFTEEDFRLAWEWIGKLERGEDLPVYDRETEVREFEMSRIFAEFIPSFDTEVSVLVNELDSSKLGTSVKKIEYSHIVNIINNFVKEIAKRLDSLNMNSDLYVIRTVLINSLADDVKTKLTVMLIDAMS